MSLWGNNDNVTSAGKITSIDYAAKTVTGSGTQWGASGSAQVGDVLRIGVRGPGVAATYFGDAVITEIASATSCSIASTASLVNPNKEPHLTCLQVLLLHLQSHRCQSGVHKIYRVIDIETKHQHLSLIHLCLVFLMQLHRILIQQQHRHHQNKVNLKLILDGLVLQLT